MVVVVSRSEVKNRRIVKIMMVCGNWYVCCFLGCSGIWFVFVICCFWDLVIWLLMLGDVCYLVDGLYVLVDGLYW